MRRWRAKRRASLYQFANAATRGRNPEFSTVLDLKDGWHAQRRRRWTRENAHLYLRPDAERFMQPGARLSAKGTAQRSRFYRYELPDSAERKYSPDQPRVPAGDPNGGQWTDVTRISTGRVASRNTESVRIRLAANITGFTRHGINQAINRGVGPAAMLDALNNPIEIVPRLNGTARYVRTGAVVVIDPRGRVITTWSK